MAVASTVRVASCCSEKQAVPTLQCEATCCSERLWWGKAVEKVLSRGELPEPFPIAFVLGKVSGSGTVTVKNSSIDDGGTVWAGRKSCSVYTLRFCRVFSKQCITVYTIYTHARGVCHISTLHATISVDIGLVSVPPFLICKMGTTIYLWGKVVSINILVYCDAHRYYSDGVSVSILDRSNAVMSQ